MFVHFIFVNKVNNAADFTGNTKIASTISVQPYAEHSNSRCFHPELSLIGHALYLPPAQSSLA